MKLEQVLRLYDAHYAREYEPRYIHAPEMMPSTMYQCMLLKHTLSSTRRWLDLACGTGFYLSIFNEVADRCGLDISPEMLRIARERNPGVEFVQGNFLQPNAAWNGRWDVITCMWWAYCLVESIHDIQTLVRNIFDWLMPTGVVLVPLCNPRRFGADKLELPSTDPRRPGIKFTGLLWSWCEADDKVHEHMVSPFPETMQELFSPHFSSVDIISAPPDVVPPGYWSSDFLVAQRKREVVLDT
jgi:SAM-dependent methyltransferase